MRRKRYAPSIAALFVCMLVVGPLSSAAQDSRTGPPTLHNADSFTDPGSSVSPVSAQAPEYIAFQEPIGLASKTIADFSGLPPRRSAARAIVLACAISYAYLVEIYLSIIRYVPIQTPVSCKLGYDNTSTNSGGPYPTTNVWMNSTVPTGLTVSSYTPPAGATCYQTPTSVDCNLSNVGANVVEVLDLTLVSTIPGSYNLDFLVSQFEFDPIPSDNILTAPFEFFDPGYILGTKYNDLNGNQIMDFGEPGVEGVEILVNDVPVATTASDGTYIINELPANTYTVSENLGSIAGWMPSTASSREVTVAESTNTVGIDFGNYIPSDIIIWKYEDVNGNGAFDDGEPFLQDWEFWLDANDDGVKDAGETVATTDGGGGAEFNGLAPGTYVVRENVASQTGWATSEARKEVTVTSGQTVISETAPEVYFANYIPSDIIIWKFEDLNGNGERDEGEPFLQNWEFWLDKNDDGIKDAGETTATTDLSGGAEFNGLAPGTYVVRENVDSQPGWATIEARKEVVVTSGQTIVSETAPEVYFANFQSGDIIVYKFEDKDGDGEKGEGEDWISGWTVSVDGVEKQTDENGEARFEDLLPGDYDVAEVIPDGWEITTDNNPTQVSLDSGESISNETPEEVWFGNRGTGIIIVKKFHDKNGDGDQDDGEEVLEGWDMTVRGETITTDGSGEARFEHVPPGDHEVEETVKTDWAPSVDNPSTVTVGPGEEKRFDFGNYRPGKIEGDKWQDDNGDGIWDAGEPALPGWTITCSGPSCPPPGSTMVTDAAGHFAFTDLKPGQYAIGEVQKPGWTMTWPVPGGGSYALTLDSGETEDFIDFGNKPPPPPPPDAADWGDAPEDVDPDLAAVFPVGYPTTAANGGAVHPVNLEIRIGALVDPELNGQPNIPADGDDTTLSDDEDGIKFLSDFVLLSRKLDPESEEETIIPGQISGTTGRIVVYPSVSGKLDGWVDWNRDGDWDDDGEKVYDGTMVTPMSDTLDWSTPESAAAGYTYARFRFTLSGVDTPGGVGSDGEVEDYVLYTLHEENLTSSDDTEDANPGDGICADASGFCTVRAAIMESNASGVPWLVNAGSLAKMGLATLLPQSPYPAITGSLLLNGAGSIEIDGSQAGAGANGFVLQSGGSYIVGSMIHDFDGDGIRIEHGNNVAFDNEIRGNGGSGINVVSGSSVVLRSNLIYNNGGLGIDLGDDGVSANDIGDNDTGANGLQNYPLLSAVTAENGHVDGSLESVANAEFTIDLFSSPVCDASGNGEGQVYLKSVNVTTDNTGTANFNAVLAGNAVAVGEVVTATATDADGNTSEFSACFVAVSTAIEEIPDAEVPNEYQLFQNYPNPFNPTTHIRFSITNREWVTLEVYDILGKKVETLVEGWVDAGEFTVEFAAHNLPSGIYLYRMTAGSFTVAKQLTLLK